MRTRGVVGASVLLAAAAFAGEVDVQSTAAGRVSMRITSAPLSEVLDRLGRQTGMKVVYDGAPPRAVVRGRQFENATPADALANILEGLGVSYALRLDATGARVDTLMVLGMAPAAGAPAGAMAGPRPAPPPLRPPGMGNAPPPVDEGDDETPLERSPAEDQRPGRGEKDEPGRPGPMGFPTFPMPPGGHINPLTLPPMAPGPGPSPTPPPQLE